MFITNDHPGDWQSFLKRKDNVGLTIMEARQKYLLEENLFADAVNNNLSPTTANTSAVGVASAGVGDNFPDVIFVGSKEDGGFPFKKTNDRKNRTAFGIPIYERLAYDIPGSIFEDAQTKARADVKIANPFLVKKMPGEEKKIAQKIDGAVMKKAQIKIPVARVVREVEGKKEQIRATLEWNDYQNNWIYTEQGVVFKVVPVGRGRFSVNKYNPFGVVSFFSSGISYLNIVISSVPFSGKNLGDSPEDQRIKAPISEKQLFKKAP